VWLGGRRFEVEEAGEHSESMTGERTRANQMGASVEASASVAQGQIGAEQQKNTKIRQDYELSMTENHTSLQVIGGDIVEYQE
jgi:hypothetical protein